MEEIRTVKALQEICHRSQEEGNPLYFFYRNSVVNRYATPVSFLNLDDRTLFEPIATFAAVEEIDYHWLFR